jgi:hypothetical protein
VDLLRVGGAIFFILFRNNDQHTKQCNRNVEDKEWAGRTEGKRVAGELYCVDLLFYDEPHDRRVVYNHKLHGKKSFLSR